MMHITELSLFHFVQLIRRPLLAAEAEGQRQGEHRAAEHHQERGIEDTLGDVELTDREYHGKGEPEGRPVLKV